MCCFKKNQRRDEQEEVYEMAQEEYYYLDEVRTAETSPWLVSLSVMNTEISFKVDSGADVTVIPAHIYESIQQRPKLQPTRAIVQDFNGKIDVQGVFKASMQHNYASRTVLIYVVRSSNCVPLLSRSDSTAIGMLRFNEEEVPANMFRECDKMACEPVQISTKMDRQFDEQRTSDEIQRPFVKFVDEDIDYTSQQSIISQQNDAQHSDSNLEVANLHSRQLSSATNQTDETSFDDVCKFTDRMIASLPGSSRCPKDVRQQTYSDPALQQVITSTNCSSHECFSGRAEPVKLTNWDCLTFSDDSLLNSDRIALAASLQHYEKRQPLRDENQPANDHASPKPPPLPDDQQLSLQGKDEDDVRQQAQRLSAEHNHSRSSADKCKDLPKTNINAKRPKLPHA